MIAAVLRGPGELEVFEVGTHTGAGPTCASCVETRLMI